LAIIVRRARSPIPKCFFTVLCNFHIKTYLELLPEGWSSPQAPEGSRMDNIPKNEHFVHFIKISKSLKLKKSLKQTKIWGKNLGKEEGTFIIDLKDPLESVDGVRMGCHKPREIVFSNEIRLNEKLSFPI
jgi:hypothetical protein